MAKCAQRKKDGKPCGGSALPGERFCTFHSPRLSKKRAAGRKAGGIRRSQKAAVLPDNTADVPVESVADVVSLLGRTINDVRTGRLDTKIANCIGLLCNVSLRALHGAELAHRVEMIEMVLKRRGS